MFKKAIHDTLIEILNKSKTGSFSRRYVANHPDATEEIILLAKAMEFIEGVVR
jgi:hypothetical protein